MRYASRVLTAAAIGLAASVAVGEEGQYMFSIPAGLAANQALPLGKDIVATLQVPDEDHAAVTLGGMQGIELLATRDGVVTVALGERATLPGEPSPDHLDASFVVDFDEPVFTGTLEELERTHGSAPTRHELTDFVYEFISDKTYVRDFDLASRVASTGEGDCTEHAVMLAALSRATGRPARVVIGVLLASSGEGVFGFGHAWAEIYDEGRWHIADATRPEDDAPGIRVFYLPMIGLENEGPGYSMDLARLVRLQPSRVSEIADAG